MGTCVGCKCCVVACNEQNGNPASINWRRVGEMEGGFYPNAQRAYLSMGCNHCVNPTCLDGCPVDAYTKDPATGIVRHSADACIGCQYCTWNCSYGVPQYNPGRGVVGKCDMCEGRMARGQADIYKHDLNMPDADVTVEYALDRLVIAGSVNSVVDQILAFRETIGDFGTLLYCGHDWIDPQLSKRSMELMAEKVMPRSEEHRLNSSHT